MVVVARVVLRSLFIAVFAFIAVGTAAAQDRRQNKPGEFDFYLLALSWSPSFCSDSRERFPTRPRLPECQERPFSFTVHGLWPHYEKGFPEFCQIPAPRLDRNIISSMLDLMPSPRLIFHEWDRHGVCSGQSARGYFESVRKARASVKIPEQYLDLKTALTVAPKDVAAAFVEANPGLSAAGLSVSCGAKRLSEVRICLTKDFKFRDCPQSVQRSCRRDQVVMPPVRGG
jgi:ribonuclease T2